jgi:segregation and condensation protein A
MLAVENKPLATVAGQPIFNCPKDLYIPPDALAVWVEEQFEGPLDLLWYLIRKNNLDVLAIPVAEVTAQYLAYIGYLQSHSERFELAAEYLAMAAWLIAIKAKMLLPKPPAAEAAEEDPRAELARRLLAYQACQRAAQALQQLPREGQDFYWVAIFSPPYLPPKAPPPANLAALYQASLLLHQRLLQQAAHIIKAEVYTVQARIAEILATLPEKTPVLLWQYLRQSEGNVGVVVALLACLELAKFQQVDIFQHENFGQVYVQRKAMPEEALPSAVN